MKKTVTITALASLALAGLATDANALDVSANGGFMSQYIFRGLPQSAGKGSAFAGLDLEQSGFYLGSWAASVNDAFVGTSDGLEVDLYGGYSREVGEFSFGIGATGYFYTAEFDDEYHELNLNGNWRFINLHVSVGEYLNFNGPTVNYQFYNLQFDYDGFYAGIGSFQDEFTGEYYEAGYGNTLSVNDVDLFDYSLSVIYSTKELLGDRDDTNLVFTISKSFNVFSN